MGGVPFVQELAKYGGGALVAALAIYFAWTYKKDLSDCVAERVKDLKSLAEVMQAFTTSNNVWIASNEARNRAAEAVAKANEIMAVQVASLTKEVGDLRGEVARLRDEVRK